MSSIGTIGQVIETSRKGFPLEWRIPGFLSLEGDGCDYYSSPSFHACDGRWFLRILPRRIWLFSKSEWVSVFLYREDSGPPQNIHVTLGIRGTEGVLNRRGKLQEFSRDKNECRWNRFCRRSEITQNNSRRMNGNALIIALEMKSDGPIVPRSEGPIVSRGCGKALEDFGKLLASGEKSDVTVQIGVVQFKVHSVILFARSPALSLSLQHECKEKASGKIVIEDCEPDAFKNFLHYLYTGSVQSLDEQNVFPLFRIADKYLAEDLKQRCLEHIQGSLSVQTFFNSMKLALTYGERSLLERATDFATKNIRTIVCSEQWQDFIREYPSEANEIFIKSLGPPPPPCKKLK